MHCASCERRIEEAAAGLPGVIKVKVNAGAGEALLEVDESEFDEAKWRAAVRALDYEVLTDKDNMSRAKTFGVMVVLVGVLFLAYLFLGRLAGVADALGARDGFSIAAALIIGVVASLSTCLALVGGIVLAFSSKWNTGNGWRGAILPQLLFHAGRIGAFFLLGGLLGWLGQWFAISKGANAVLILIVAVIMISFGFSNLGFKFGSLMPGGSRRSLRWLEKWKNSEHRAAPAILGAITFFLPCGFTQSMQLTAVTLGSFWPAAWLMTAFALGTAPVLLTLGVASGAGRISGSQITRKIIGIVIIVFAIYTAMTAFALLDGGSAAGQLNGATASDKIKAQEIVMTVDYNGFTPNNFTLKRGVPVRWIINAKKLTGCNNEIIVPALSLDKKLSAGVNIVEFTPTQVGTIKFSCWMGMIRGKFLVAE